MLLGPTKVLSSADGSFKSLTLFGGTDFILTCAFSFFPMNFCMYNGKERYQYSTAYYAMRFAFFQKNITIKNNVQLR